jgi:hypothetical protein
MNLRPSTVTRSLQVSLCIWQRGKALSSKFAWSSRRLGHGSDTLVVGDREFRHRITDNIIR